MKSSQRVAVVTGNNQGLGQAIVLEFARHGVTVVSTSRDAQQGAAAVERAAKAEPQLAELIHFHQLDITSEQSVAELAAWLQSTVGRLDILTNYAGITKQRLDAYEYAEETFGVNYNGTRRVMEKLVPLLRASPHGARILMITSQISLLEHFTSNENVGEKVSEAVDCLDKSILDSLVAKVLGGHEIGACNRGEVGISSPLQRVEAIPERPHTCWLANWWKEGKTRGYL